MYVRIPTPDALQPQEDLTMIGKLLRHTQAQTTVVYAHLKTTLTRAAADKALAANAAALQKPEQAA